MDFGIVTVIILGGVMGEFMRRLSFKLIKNRIDQYKSAFLSSRLSSIAWILTGSLGCFIISLIIRNVLISIEYMGIFLVLLSLSSIDLSIRKIPNELLLALLAIKISEIAVLGAFISIFPALVGLLVGFILFLIPSYIGIEIGWGDIKLAAISGLYLGTIGVFQAVLIMAAVMAIYLIYLVLTKKGNLKTKVAIGPPLSLGMMITLLFPITTVL